MTEDMIALQAQLAKQPDADIVRGDAGLYGAAADGTGCLRVLGDHQSGAKRLTAGGAGAVIHGDKGSDAHQH